MFQVNPLKNQALFSSKDKSEKLKCQLLQFCLGALRVKLSVMHGGGVSIPIHPVNYYIKSFCDFR